MHRMLDAIVVQAIDRTVLIKSKCSSGFMGVGLVDKGRYRATCQTAPCHKNHLGMFGTPEDGSSGVPAALSDSPRGAGEGAAARTTFSAATLKRRAPCNHFKRLAGWADMQQQLKNS